MAATGVVNIRCEYSTPALPRLRGRRKATTFIVRHHGRGVLLPRTGLLKAACRSAGFNSHRDEQAPRNDSHFTIERNFSS